MKENRLTMKEKIMPVNGSFALPELPYEKTALEPVISAETLEYHYGKHFKAYVDNLNRMIAEDDYYANKSLQEIVLNSDGGIFNNSGQALNHQLYFEQLKSPAEGNAPVGTLAEKISAQYGSFEEFKEEFKTAATTLFGSGWTYLSADKDGSLHITKEPNADNPLTDGLKPLLSFDVWEHAYYLDYQNLRAKYLDEFWKIIDWNVIENRYKTK